MDFVDSFEEDVFKQLISDFEKKLNRSLTSKERDYMEWLAKEHVSYCKKV